MSTTAASTTGNNDVAQILGTSGGSSTTTTTIPRALQTSNPLYYNMSSSQNNKSGKFVTLLTGTTSASTSLASATLPSIVPKLPKATVKKPARKWIWAPFTSSARLDGTEFRHWVRAGVEYPDYPYARFDIHLDNIQDEYASMDYNTHFATPPSDDNSASNSTSNSYSWTKSETDTLIQLVETYELRWPIIYDNWKRTFGNSYDDGKQMEELQHRYYTIASILTKARIQPSTTNNNNNNASNVGEPQVPCIGMGSSSGNVLDLQVEQTRREQADFLWHRTKEEEKEEEELLQELKKVELQIRKLKKSGTHLLAAAAATASSTPSNKNSNTASSSTNTSTGSVEKVWRDVQLASTTPVPTPGTPYLQSARLTTVPRMNKTTLKHMTQMLTELNVGRPTIPTKRICDTHDKVRQQALVLLILQKLAIQKETQVAQRQIKYQKLQQQHHHQKQKQKQKQQPPILSPPPPTTTTTTPISYPPPPTTSTTTTTTMIPSSTKTTKSSSTTTGNATLPTTMPVTAIRRAPPSSIITTATPTTSHTKTITTTTGTVPSNPHTRMIPMTTTSNTMYAQTPPPPMYVSKSTQNRTSNVTAKKGNSDKMNHPTTTTTTTSKKSSSKRKSTSKKQQQQQLLPPPLTPTVPLPNASSIPPSILPMPTTTTSTTATYPMANAPSTSSLPQQPSKKRSRKN